MMRHAHDRRRSGREFLVQHLFILAVQRAGGFVEQYIPRVFQQHPRERQPLPLADRQDLFEVEFLVEAAAALFQIRQVDALQNIARLVIGRGRALDSDSSVARAASRRSCTRAAAGTADRRALGRSIVPVPQFHKPAIMRKQRTLAEPAPADDHQTLAARDRAERSRINVRS